MSEEPGKNAPTSCFRHQGISKGNITLYSSQLPILPLMFRVCTWCNREAWILERNWFGNYEDPTVSPLECWGSGPSPLTIEV